MKKVKRKIMLTIEEYSLYERERDPYTNIGCRTPVMEKIARAGIDPTAIDLYLEHKYGNDYITLSQEVEVLTIGERFKRFLGVE